MNKHKGIAVGVMMSCFWGCAFKEPLQQPESSQQSQSEPEKNLAKPSIYRTAVDWSSSGKDLEANLKTVRQLIAKGTADFEGDQPVSLPVDVPQNLFVTVEVPDSIMTETPQFVRGVIQRDGDPLQMEAQVVIVEDFLPGRKRLVMHVSGVNVAFDKEQSQSGTLDLEVYGKVKKLVHASLNLRTPPRQVKIQGLQISEVTSEKYRYRAGFLRPVLGEKRLNLVRAFYIENQEKTPIEIQYDRRNKATLSQWVNTFSHRDTGCGYVVDQNPHTEQFATDMLMLPMDASLITQGRALLKEPALQDRASLFLEPGDAKSIGLYAVGTGSDQWLDQGPKGSSLSDISVSNDCYEVCTQRECDYSGGPRGIMGALEFEPLGPCHCVHSETRRQSATVRVGVERGPVTLSVPEGRTIWSVRYADLSFQQDSEVRRIDAIPGKSEVLWY